MQEPLTVTLASVDTVYLVLKARFGMEGGVSLRNKSSRIPTGSCPRRSGKRRRA